MRYLISSIPKIHIPPKTVDPRRVRTVSGLFLPKIKKGATTHDEEENAADHHILQNAAGQQAKQRRKTAQTAWVEAFTKICYNFFEEILKIVKPNPIFVGIYSEGT